MQQLLFQIVLMMVYHELLLLCRVCFNFMDVGVYLDYYNGDVVSPIQRYDTRVYFVCKQNVTIDGPRFEHLKDNYSAHFHVFTKYACK